MIQEIKNIYLRRSGGAFINIVQNVDIDNLILISISKYAECYCYQLELFLYYYENKSWYIQK